MQVQNIERGEPQESTPIIIVPALSNGHTYHNISRAVHFREESSCYSPRCLNNIFLIACLSTALSVAAFVATIFLFIMDEPRNHVILPVCWGGLGLCIFASLATADYAAREYSARRYG